MPEPRVLGKRPDGRELRGYPIGFHPIEECWSEYRLEDGSRIRVRQTLLKVYRLVDDDGNDAFDDFGDPEVFVNGNMAIAAFRGTEDT